MDNYCSADVSCYISRDKTRGAEQLLLSKVFFYYYIMYNFMSPKRIKAIN